MPLGLREKREKKEEENVKIMDSSDDEDQQKVAAMSAAFASDHMRLSSEEESDPESVFELLEKLGEGSYGSVWRAKHRASGKEYAIKRVPVENDLEALQVEIEFMKSCVSPFIVQYFGSYIKVSTFSFFQTRASCFPQSKRLLFSLLGDRRTNFGS